MNKEQAKEKIKKLVERYENLSPTERNGYNEQQTKDHFIRPLFEALGWNFEHDVWPETDVSGKRVDYAVKIDGITKFFIEAKAIPVNLDEEKWAEQAINYSYHQSVPWVILTDFEGIKVFNTEWDEPNIQSCQFIELRYTEFLENEKLWWLSKEGFSKGLLDKKAEEFGRKPKKTPVDEQLAQDLVRWRDCLYHNLETYNSGKIDKIKIAEYVQMILNRLIFIRTLEEKGYEDHLLDPLVKNWGQSKSQKIVLALNKIFRKIDKDYDSGLFEEGNRDRLSEKLEYDDEVFINVIKELYYNSQKIRYKFDQIPSDIFGSIYEQYLGQIQQTGKQEKKSSKRKAQGIYYTPRYIVDYIVRNTLGEVLKEKSSEQIRDIKVLDPACGSGSFLIHAYQKLLDYWQEAENKKFAKADKAEKLWKQKTGYAISTERKMRILLNNIYGVDLDEEAVEIARLNLLLKMVGKKMKLPNLDGNIENGNSLISGQEEELKKYFGKNWKEKKPFDWQEKFADVFKHGGFDVIIGNPPYVNLANIKDADEREYLKKEYETAKNKSDLYSFFTEKAIKLLKPGGILGFIFSNSWLGTDSFSLFREYLVKNTKVIQMVKLSLGVFEDATVTPILIFLKKEKAEKGHKIKLYELRAGKFEKLSNDLSYERIIDSPSYNFSFNPEIEIKIPVVKLGDIAKFSLGIKTSDDERFILNSKKDEKCYKMLRGKDVNRYNHKYAGKWIWYMPDLMMEKVGAGPRKIEYFLKDKIFIKDVATKIEATFDNEKYLSVDTLTVIYYSANYSLKFILALLNSNFVNKWFKTNFPAGLHIKINQLENIPIPKINFKDKKEKAKHDELVKLADKMLEKNKELQKLDPIMDEKEYNEIKEEIKKTDKKIDQEVYRLYGLTEKEIKIVEKA